MMSARVLVCSNNRYAFISNKCGRVWRRENEEIAKRVDTNESKVSLFDLLRK